MEQTQSEYILKPRQGLSAFAWGEIFAYRDLLWFLAWRNINVRYKQTVIGAAWAIGQPFITMIVFSVFFGRLAQVPSDGLPYPIFVYAGLLPWTFFSNVIRMSATSVVEDEKLITKVYFPRIIIPASVAGVELIDFGVAFLIYVAMMMYFGTPFTVQIFLVPALLVLMTAASLGCGLMLAALTVAYRDFRYIVPFMIQLGLYVSPVIYPVSLVPEKWRWLLALNPMSGIIDGFRSALLGKPFDGMTLSISAAVSLGLFIAGVLYFKRLERTFADII
ncbi:MAG: ABC transporter permease [Candidatus Andersenbacteria bacterium]|nr:ABC transporter permease [Candidatus Andersenbacteria bacterium]